MHSLVLLAKLVVENYIKDYNPPTASSRLRRAPRKIISPPYDLPKKFLKKRAGTFVTIEKELQVLPRKEPKILLRGCIATYLPIHKNIAEEIIHNAIAAATEDYRFGPIRKEELPHLSYTVYILGEPQLIKDIKKLDPKKYGIIVKTVPIISASTENVLFNGHLPYKSGLLLPDLEGIDTVEQQISIACQKAGIDLLKEKVIIYRFTTEKYQ
jgi:uncharacterized protein (TIGR00296 family)